ARRRRQWLKFASRGFHTERRNLVGSLARKRNSTSCGPPWWGELAWLRQGVQQFLEAGVVADGSEVRVGFEATAILPASLHQVAKHLECLIPAAVGSFLVGCRA